MPKISIIVPVYNTGEPLKRCLDSLIAQTQPDLEILVVDDGSTDPKTVKLCDEFQENYPAHRVFHLPNGGPSAARNYGIQKAKGEYVCFVDSDDWIEPETCGLLLKAVESGEYGLSVCGMSRDFVRGEEISSSEILTTGDHPIESDDDFKKYFCPLYENTLLVVVLAKLYRKENLQGKSVLFEPGVSLGEDMLFNFQYLKTFRKIAVVNIPLYHYVCGQEASLTRQTRFQWETFAQNCRLFREGRAFFQKTGLWETNGGAVAKHFLKSVFICLETILCRDGHLTASEQKAACSKILSSAELKEALMMKKPSDTEFLIYRLILSTHSAALIRSFTKFRFWYKNRKRY